MPGGPRSPRSPLGPTVPLQWEQMQKKGIWSTGGGIGALNSMSQIAMSGAGGIGESVAPSIRSMSGPWVMFPVGGHCSPGGGICRGLLRALGDHRDISSEDCSSLDSDQRKVLGSDVEPSSSEDWYLVVFRSSMAEQMEDRTKSPSRLDNIWRKIKAEVR